MKKILILNKLYDPWVGGVEQVVKTIAEGLDKQKFKVTVLAMHERKGKSARYIQNGVQIIKTKQRLFFGPTPISFDFIKEYWQQKADLIHIHHPDPWATVAAVLVPKQAPIIVTYHSDVVRQRILKFLFYPFLFVLLLKAQRIVATSPNLIRSSWILCLFRSKVTTIPLGLDFKGFDRFTKFKDSNYLLSVGRLVEYKGYAYLIEAMRYVPHEKLYIVGNGRLHDYLQRKIKQYNLEKRVYILRGLPFSAIKGLYAHCKAFILSSISENEAFGLVQLEAMYYDKPVITTDLPTGVTFVNRHKKTGLVVQRKNAQALAQAIQKIGALKTKNKQYVLAHFTAQQMVSAYGRLYSSSI